MSTNDLTLWGMGTPRQLRPHWMLAELGLDYDYQPIQSRTGETMTPEFLKLNPRHKVPVLRHRDFVLTESAAIIAYLADAFPTPQGVFVPRDARARAMVAEWSFFVMSELDAHSLYVIRRHVDLAHLYGEAPTAVQAAREYFSENLGAMTAYIAARPAYLFGDALSTADILLTTCLDWALRCDIALPEPFLAYHARATARPAYLAARERAFKPS